MVELKECKGLAPLPQWGQLRRILTVLEPLTERAEISVATSSGSNFAFGPILLALDLTKVVSYNAPC